VYRAAEEMYAERGKKEKETSGFWYLIAYTP